jgi:phosphoribosylamine--glycine ligase
VGSGGREHTLAWALARSPQLEQVYVAPGNAGTTWPADPSAVGWRPRAAATNVPISSDDLPELVAFAREQGVDLTVVGPEAPLSAGIVDRFQAAGLRIFGPGREAARLESSKVFAKAFMRDCGIPTAEYAAFDDYDAARRFLQEFDRPVVVKADGLAAGKGVVVCDEPDQAEAALRRMMLEREFGPAGDAVVIEERLSGREVSVLAFTDGRAVVPMPPARDHKRACDGDQGPNTGGMGAFAPAPDVEAALVDEIARTILRPAVDGMAARGAPYLGVLYAGVILTHDGPKLLEFNCRFGDPETQVILPLLETDLLEILLACAEGWLHRLDVRPGPRGGPSEAAGQAAGAGWRSGACATVVMASPGYPGAYPRGLPISGVEDASALDNVVVFHAGTARRNGALVTAGGRVLDVTAIGSDLPSALKNAYAGVERIHFEGAHYRRDIGSAPLGIGSAPLEVGSAPLGVGRDTL